jgi:hypothetical protein
MARMMLIRTAIFVFAAILVDALPPVKPNHLQAWLVRRLGGLDTCARRGI